MNTSLKHHLKKNNITYATYTHQPLFTVEQSKKLKQNIPGLHTKSLFLKDEHIHYYLACIPAEKRLDTKKIKEYFNVRELHFASPKELQQELNVAPGSVSLFALLHAKQTILILDHDIWNASLVGFHPNVNTATLVLTHTNLEKFCASLRIKKHILPISL